MKDKITTIKALQRCLDDFTTENFLIPEAVKKNNLIKCCIDLLKESGYIVKTPPKTLGNVKTMKSLIDHYYIKLSIVHPDVLPNRDEKKDSKIGAELIKRIRRDFDVEYKEALSYAVRLINLVLDNEDKFDIDHGMVCSFSVFGQGKMKWITDKAISILNSTAYSDAYSIALADKWGDDYLAENGKELGYL